MVDAIYYPYFEPPATWLRRAALCWNRVYTVRTPDAPPAPEEIAELDDALGGVLVSIEPNVPTPDLIEEFLNWVDENRGRWQAVRDSLTRPTPWSDCCRRSSPGAS